MRKAILSIIILASLFTLFSVYLITIPRQKPTAATRNITPTRSLTTTKPILPNIDTANNSAKTNLPAATRTTPTPPSIPCSERDTTLSKAMLDLYNEDLTAITNWQKSGGYPSYINNQIAQDNTGLGSLYNQYATAMIDIGCTPKIVNPPVIPSITL
jgi:hypothetical protein